ncbi:hypothetical protein MPTK1_7g06260 [Marchantia polymorpha subsp. ruderalis]|uniref:Uncharacterized protein n=2 Tax=Marchantia polymorpha TaxID=3197 RepID=A0AAF6BWQ0_MARPO|nr:hypothetical protein MARPO_0057s0045 [Marchantia polymorpha]BBN16434.1 hypothetical protein Mp_7g06260 [Marchantia polymorpha subsp. ruderalis]|eukprot:PTQ37408.1 hypothetical protein MARPO_0057s0045 [Marchantia polymorpha]
MTDDSGLRARASSSPPRRNSFEEFARRRASELPWQKSSPEICCVFASHPRHRGSRTRRQNADRKATSRHGTARKETELCTESALRRHRRRAERESRVDVSCSEPIANDPSVHRHREQFSRSCPRRREQANRVKEGSLNYRRFHQRVERAKPRGAPSHRDRDRGLRFSPREAFSPPTLDGRDQNAATAAGAATSGRIVPGAYSSAVPVPTRFARSGPERGEVAQEGESERAREREFLSLPCGRGRGPEGRERVLFKREGAGGLRSRF